MKTVIASIALFGLLATTHAADGTAALEKGFVDPPASARPGVLWFWLSHNITRDGITRDLEAFERAGVGYVWLMNGSLVPNFIQPPVTFMTPEWREMFRHTLTECRRLGLKLVVANCDGWSHSGGHWITPEMGMQRVVHAELRVEGPRRFAGKLPVPHHKAFYKDIAVLAWPTPTGDGGTATDSPPKLSTNGQVEGQLTSLVDGDPDTGVRLGAAPAGQPLWLRMDFERPVRSGAVRCCAVRRPIDGGYYVSVTSNITLQASADGNRFADVVAVPPVLSNLLGVDVWGPKTAAFAPQEASAWRLVFDGPAELREVELIAGGRVHRWEDKSGQMADFILPADATPAAPQDMVVDPDAEVDLTGNMGKQGRLTWDIPAGAWTVLRLGHTWTGGVVQPASAGAAPEVDKMDPDAVEHHYRSFVGELLKDFGTHAGREWIGVEMDSWEPGSSNWTPTMMGAFRRRRGYDPKPYLPVLAGRVVGDAERSDRFLFDYRRTIAELVADGIYGRFRSHLAPHGVQLWAEALGPTIQRGRIQYQQLADSLQCKGRVDVPMGEFWVCPPQHGEPAFDTKEAASAAHLYGKPVAAAEAFTAFAHVGWTDHPAMLKTLGDLQFCQGINRFLFSESVHQPWADKQPGLTLGAWGMHFQWTTTWFPYCHAWLTYLARCQHLLQQGRFVADICYYLGEDAPVRLWEGALQPKPPAGYDYDACTAEALLNRVSVKDGRIVLPDGMRYRLLVLSDSRRMTPKVAAKVKQLVESGATVVGVKPGRSPSLVGYPQCDEDVKRLADPLWGNVNGQTVTQRRVGQGRIINGRTLEEVLRGDGVPPDFEVVKAKEDAQLVYIHRRNAGTDIYFVSNQRDRAEAAECAFRVAGKQPEIWDPVTGERWDAVRFRQAEGRTVVPMDFAPAQSYFVVFRRSASLPEQTAGAANFPSPTAVLRLKGPWRVRFDAEWGGPEEVTFDRLEDWAKRPEEGIRYYSGTARYRKTFDLPEALRGGGKRLYLDLGTVKNIAQVQCNGKRIGVVWTAPWRVEITHAIKPAGNDLEIAVANLWVNRLVRDAGLPEGKRLTWTTHNPYKPDSPLLPSGLLGPVTLQSAEPINVRRP